MALSDSDESKESAAATAEEKNDLCGSSDPFRQVFDENPHPMWVFDRQTFRFLAVNDAAVRTYGWSRQEFLNDLTLLDVRPAEERDPFLQRHQNSGFDDIAWDEPRQHRTKDGSLLWVIVANRAFHFAGRPARMATITDVTAQYTQREQMRRMMQGARCLIWEAQVTERPREDRDFEHGPFDWSVSFFEEEAARRWLPIAVAPEESFNVAWDRSKHPQDIAQMHARALTALREGRGGYSQEFRCTLADGSFRWLREDVRIEPVTSAFPGEAATASEPARPPRRYHLVGVCIDITERKRMEAQLVQTDKLAALSGLVGGIAHEINNPLAAIGGYAQMLVMHPDPEVQADGNMIVSLSNRASRIIRSMRVYANPETARAPRRPTSLSTVIDSALDVVRHRLRNADVELELDLADDLPSVLLNEGEMTQVLVNLLTNAEYALRATPIERRRIRIATARQTTLFPDESSKGCVLTVTDTGSGMSDAIRSRIFEPFFSTKDAGEGTGDGMGLGLYISHSIVVAHSGIISVDSQEGEGTTFTIRLPAIVSPA